jgi:hypothetical protein
LSIFHGIRSDAPHLSDEHRAAFSAGRYRVAIQIMREMQWSWNDLISAPFDLVDELVWRISAEREWEHEKQKAHTGKGKSKPKGKEV